MTPKLNDRNRMDGLSLLASIKDGSAALVMFDPQYRGVLDKMAYGNEGARQSGRAALPQMPDRMIAAMFSEIERVLRPRGHIGLWVDKFSLVSGRWHRWVPDPCPMREVDCLIWEKEGAPGMGRRFRYTWEAMIVVQKAPIGCVGQWPDRSMRDLYRSKPDRKLHPHAKPVPLLERFITQVTRKGDLVVDPCAGGYGVLRACLATKRRFMGCDLAT